MRRAPSEQCDYVFEGSAADCYAVFRKNNKVKKSNITGCSAVGSAPALGVPWRYPGQVMAKRRKALRRLRLWDFPRLQKAAQNRL